MAPPPPCPDRRVPSVVGTPIAAVTDPGGPTDCENARLHWYSCYLALPDEGVAAAFPDHRARRARVEAAKWPVRKACRRCEGSLKKLRSPRDIYQCVDCRRQETLTAGTVLEGTHLDLSVWFAAAERHITHQAVSGGIYAPLVQDVVRETGCDRTTARRILRPIERDLNPSGPGFLSRVVCIQKEWSPDRVLEGNAEQLASLEGEVRKAFDRRLLTKRSTG